MPRRTMHRLADVSARSERAGIAIRIGDEPAMILAPDLARRLAAVLAVALLDVHSARRVRSREPGNGG